MDMREKVLIAMDGQKITDQYRDEDILVRSLDVLTTVDGGADIERRISEAIAGLVESGMVAAGSVEHLVILSEWAVTPFTSIGAGLEPDEGADASW